MVDRFGPLPSQTVSLINIVRLRWQAKKIGLVKLYLRNGRMTGYFTGSHDSPFFQSDKFGKVLEFIKDNPSAAVMKEIKGSLSLRFEKVTSVEKAIGLLQNINMHEAVN